MKITAVKLAEMIGATVEGNPDVIISSPAKIEEAGPGSITFLANPAYEHHLYNTGASAVLVSLDFAPREPVKPTLLRVADVYGTVSNLLAVYKQDEAAQTRRAVSAHAAVEDTATLGDNVRIGKFSVVEQGAVIGEGTVILDQVYIGPNVTIGKDCVLYPGVRVLRDCVLGDNCVLHANVVIGGDGFGFAPDPETGRYNKVPQIGNVVLHDRVEIGASTTIDRATMGSTVIHSGVKLDNLIQVAHNVEIGENTVIAAQAGIAGSAKIGKNCRIGGQAGIGGHCTLADGTQVQAQSGVINNITKSGAKLGGSPHMHYPDYLRSYAVFKNLPSVVNKLRKDIAELRRQIGQ
ncbi:UDP-3-O-(3-hydroxymyristoyl)glucosamine N-acyltransferase [Neolewinella aurantiaca]|uniref:UDP-3-O-acylglucosamine N-acyltransferase n=1 Tax=Neolewinella aurantiaca TaxID=2602767 RepID=A0A5C7FM92_9BACT|nr:UDP-3-O-(3-hydroxymyristoyl)glucosamine N-acyltransferase [Neolewinella aurantiaca]TXF88556.1 UDP-3-O-(3-hydroxymyristoyl)glucosamine N-acyltransferase [Neolewinella aurantiaca]